MRIYFTYSRKLPASKIEQLNKTLENLGHNVIHRNRPSQYNSVDFKEAEDVFKYNVKSIKSCDIVVAEISCISGGGGYEISLALDEKKPVIAIYSMTDYKDVEGHITSVPVTFKGNTSNYLFLKEYNSANVEKILQLALNDARSVLDTKFILIIPPRIDRYLEWNAKERGVAKAEVTRESIEKAMNADKKYQEYLKSQGISE